MAKKHWLAVLDEESAEYIKNMGADVSMSGSDVINQAIKWVSANHEKAFKKHLTHVKLAIQMEKIDGKIRAAEEEKKELLSKVKNSVPA